jgi:RHS repeat-associated protein
LKKIMLIRKIITIVLCLSLIIAYIPIELAKAAGSKDTEKVAANSSNDVPAPSPPPGESANLQPEPTTQPTFNPESSFSRKSLNSNDLPSTEVVTVSEDVYNAQDQSILILENLKTKTLQKQGLLSSERGIAGSSTFKSSIIPPKFLDLTLEEIKELALAGASKIDVYWINYLLIDQPDRQSLELWKWKQEKGSTWEEVQQLLEQDSDIYTSVQEEVYAPLPASLSLFVQPSVVSSVYGEKEGLPNPQRSTVGAVAVTSFDAAVSSVFNEIVVHTQINQTQKPQYNDRNTTDEVIDPVSGSLNRKENLIHLPGVDGLDLDVGLKYNSNQGVAFTFYDTWSEYWQMWDRHYSYKFSDLGTGWSFQFPRLQGVRDNGTFYHDGTGNVYKLGSNDELSNYTKLINYKGKDKRFVDEVWNEGQFSNGQTRSSSYIEYSNMKREYFSSYGDLIGIVDRFGNQIVFRYGEYGTYGKLSSITDTTGRLVQFKYEDNLNRDPFTEEKVEITVLDGSKEVEKFVLAKGRALVDILGNTGVPPLQTYVPVLTSITDQKNGEKTTFQYENNLSVYASYGFMFTSLLKKVTYPHARSVTDYDYEWAYRKIDYYDGVREYRITSRRDLAGTKAYQQMQYSYIGDYTGEKYGEYPGSLPNDYRYSSTSTVISSTASNGLQTTNTFDKDGRVLRTEVREAGGERKVTDNTAFHPLFTQSPTRTTISEYAPSDTEASANYLYTETVFNDWGLIQSQTVPLPGDKFNNDWIKQHYTTYYQYDPNFRFVTAKSWYQKESDATPVTEYYSYTANGRPESVMNPLGEQTVFSYNYINATGGISQSAVEKWANGHKVSKNVVVFGVEGRRAYPTETQQWFNIGQANQQILKTNMTYDLGTGLLKSKSDGNDQTTQYEYDTEGRLKKEIQPVRTNAKGEAYSEVIEHNYYNQISPTLDAYNTGTPVLKVDTNRIVTSLSNGSTVTSYTNVHYNGMGLALLEERLDENAGKWVFTHYHYDDLGRPVYQKDALGNEISVGYDSWGNQNRSTDSYGNVHVTNYDLKQRKSTGYLTAADTSEVLHYIEASYDARGQMVSKRTYKDWPNRQQPIVESYNYDIIGNVTGYTDPMNHKNDAGVTTAYQYDALNRLTAIQDALNQTTRYRYDGNGQLGKVTVQGKGGTEETLNTKAYNEIGLLTTKMDGSSQSESLSYNNLGQLSGKTDRNGSVFGYSYDERGQLKSSTISGTINNVSQTQKMEFIDGDSTPKQQTIKNYINGSIKSTQQLMTDSFGQVRGNYSVAGSHSASLSNQKDALGRITQLSDNYLAFNVNYQYNKQRLDKVQTNGQSVLSNAAADNAQYSYYANGLVKSILYPTLTDGTILRTDYAYNKALGWIESMSNSKGGSVLSSYTYSYDNNGNITTVNEVRANGLNKKTDYDYDALNRLLSITQSDGGRTTYTYDVRGNRLSLTNTASTEPIMADTSYNYDLQNILTSVTKEGSATRFEYYASGLRFLKSTGNSHTQVNYDFNGQVITEEKLNGSSIIQKANFVRGDRVLVKKDKTASKDYYYLYNGHGDVVQIVDTSGNLVNNYSYDEWGNITSQTEGTSNPFKYTGEIYDEETGLYYLRARYYDPSIGRFLNEDTYEGQINNPLSLNLYTYVENNPLTHVDPTGHYTENQVDLMLTTARIAGSKSQLYWDIRSDLGSSKPIQYLDEKGRKQWLYLFNMATSAESSNEQVASAKNKLMRDYGEVQSLNDAFLGAILGMYGDGGKANVLKTQVKGQTLKLINKETDMLAKYLGFTKTNIKIKNKPVYTDGKNYIVQDLDSHNGGVWKMAKKAEDLSSKNTRSGTYDALLNRIGD